MNSPNMPPVSNNHKASISEHENLEFHDITKRKFIEIIKLKQNTAKQQSNVITDEIPVDDNTLLSIEKFGKAYQKESFSKHREETDDLSACVTGLLDNAGSTVTPSCNANLTIACVSEPIDIEQLYAKLLNYHYDAESVINDQWEFTYMDTSIVNYEITVQKTDSHTLNILLNSNGFVNPRTQNLIDQLKYKLSKKISNVSVKSATDRRVDDNAQM